MTSEPKKPGVAFWVTVVVVVVLVGYPLSFGPACWLLFHGPLLSSEAAHDVYQTIALGNGEPGGNRLRVPTVRRPLIRQA